MRGLEPDVYQSLHTIRDYCIKNAREIERWPSFYRRRYYEFLSYLSFFPESKLNSVLELGCGIGYQSAFLAKVADRVIATDLEEEDIQDHAPGIKLAEQLHEKLKISNIELKACSAEDLPFPANSFDMVFSSHVFEHIPDQSKALIEIHRVLKPGGIHFCVVPTSTEKVYAFFNFYTYLIYRSIVHIYKKCKRIINRDGVIADKSTSISERSATSILRDFPFPPPHGHYLNYLDELKSWTPNRWAELMKLNGEFQLIRQATTQINPLLSVLGAVFPKLGTSIHGVTRKLELYLGKWKLFQWFGMNTVLIFKNIK